MSLEKITYGSLASSEVVNNNFEYLDNRDTVIEGKIYSNNANLETMIANVESSTNQKLLKFETEVDGKIKDIDDNLLNKNKATIISWMIPNYSASVSFTQYGTYTPTYNCLFLSSRIAPGDSAKLEIRLGSSSGTVLSTNITGEFPGKADRIFLPLRKGQTYYISATSGHYTSRIVPLIGG